ncbi:MAG: PepSY-like domain-containing protein [Alloprevotella sp.]|nr:PepSY-like domain-containing protein [Alloprevotella sp.]
MKKSMFALVAMLLLLCVSAQANDRVITFDQLPQSAQTLVKTHFADKVPLIITADYDDYEILFESGEKIEFSRKGEWKDIECKTSAVPVALIPEQIKASIAKSFPAATIVCISRDRRGYEVELNNGLDVEFNKKFQVIEIDN